MSDIITALRVKEAVQQSLNNSQEVRGLGSFIVANYKRMPQEKIAEALAALVSVASASAAAYTLQAIIGEDGINTMANDIKEFNDIQESVENPID